METPPELPPTSRPPLGNAFFWTLLGPVASMGVAAIASLDGNRGSGNAGIGLWFLTLPVMLVCSIICAVWVGQRKGAGIGFLAFLGIQVFYIAVATAGCAAVAQNFNMH